MTSLITVETDLHLPAYSSTERLTKKTSISSLSDKYLFDSISLHAICVFLLKYWKR